MTFGTVFDISGLGVMKVSNYEMRWYGAVVCKPLIIAIAYFDTNRIIVGQV